MNGGITVNNLPDWAKEKKFIVFRMVDDRAWFYDAWHDYNKALEQAIEVNGQIVPIECVQNGKEYAR